jgi:hypothetical protein
VTLSIYNIPFHFAIIIDTICVILKEKTFFRQPKIKSFRIVIRVWAKQPGNQGLIPGEDKRFFCVPQNTDQLWAPNILPSNWYRE